MGTSQSTDKTPSRQRGRNVTHSDWEQIRDLFQKSELMSYRDLWRQLRMYQADVRRHGQDRINEATFKRLLGIHDEKLHASLSWLSSMLFQSFGWLYRRFAGDSDSSDDRDNNNIPETIMLHSNAILAGLAVYVPGLDLSARYRTLAYELCPDLRRQASKGMSATDQRVLRECRMALIFCSLIMRRSGEAAEAAAGPGSPSTPAEPHTDCNGFGRRVMPLEQLVMLVQGMYILWHPSMAQAPQTPVHSSRSSSVIGTENQACLGHGSPAVAVDWEDLDYISSYVRRSMAMTQRREWDPSDVTEVLVTVDDFIKWTRVFSDHVFDNIGKLLEARFLAGSIIGDDDDDDGRQSSSLWVSTQELYRRVGYVTFDPGIQCLGLPQQFLLLLKLGRPKVLSTPTVAPAAAAAAAAAVADITDRKYGPDAECAGNDSHGSAQAPSALSPPSVLSLCGWDDLYNSTRDGASMSQLYSRVLFYPGPTLLLVRTTLRQPNKTRLARRSSMHLFGEGGLVPSLPSHKIPDWVFPLRGLLRSPSAGSDSRCRGGEEVLIGVFIDEPWKESKIRGFGGAGCFIIFLEPFFMILPSRAAATAATPTSEGSTPHLYSHRTFGVHLASRQDGGSSAHGAGGNSIKLSISRRVSVVAAPGSTGGSGGHDSQLDHGVLFISSDFDHVVLYNDPLGTPPRPPFEYLDTARPFRVDLELSGMTVFGLGNQAAKGEQIARQEFEKEESERRAQVNLFKGHKQYQQRKRRGSADYDGGTVEDEIAGQRALLEMAGLIHSDTKK